MDPVLWDDLEAVSGPPADELAAYVEAADRRTESDSFDVVKCVYDEERPTSATAREGRCSRAVRRPTDSAVVLEARTTIHSRAPKPITSDG